MGYIGALEAAGATVLADSHFGSYQGDWLALVDYKGQRGFVHGSYGSCSGCDSFQAEFDYSDNGCDEHRYDSREECEDCKAETDSYNTRLAEFGRGYLEHGDGEVDLSDYDTTLANLSRNLEWDSEAPQMVAWVEGLKDTYYG